METILSGIEVCTVDGTNRNARVISKGNESMLVSYDTNIVLKKGDKVFLDELYWRYSTATSKHRNIFLDEKIIETRKKIESGEYELTNLNG